MKSIVLFILFFISFGIKAQEPEKKKSTPPPGTSQERSINEPGIKPKKKSASKSRAAEPAPAQAPPPNAPAPPPGKKDTLRKPE
jgi:hypothetical protein